MSVLVHLVLFRPKPDLSTADREALVEAIRDAARTIPVVRRFHIGAAVAEPPPYRAAQNDTFPYCALVELDDRAALDAYLTHPAHAALSARFNAALDAAAILDFEMTDARDLRAVEDRA